MKQQDYTTPNRRTQANRSNAQHSTGPRTDAGKSVSRLNAVKTALTGRTVLLPDDDMDRYTQHIAEWEAELQPAGPRETALVQAIADAYWRAERILRLEFALYAQGRIQFGNHFPEHGANDSDAAADPALHAHLIEVRTYLTYERQFRNLSTQEARLRRQRDKDQAALNELQAQRKATEAEQQKQRGEATKLYDKAQENETRLNPARHGFVFSRTEIAANFDEIFDQNDNEENADDKEAEIPEPGSRWTPDAA